MFILMHIDNIKIYYKDKRLRIENNEYGPSYSSSFYEPIHRSYKIHKSYRINGKLHNEKGYAVYH